MHIFGRKLGSSMVLLGLALGVQAAPALKVLSASPRGENAVNGRQAVTVTFNQPVAALAQATQFAQGTCPLVLTPSVPGVCRFAGTQSVLFEPQEPWPQATRFTVRVKEDFASQLSGEKLAAAYQFSFSTQTPQVRQVLPRPGEHWVALTPTLYVAFNLPVRPEALPRFITLTDEKGNRTALSARGLTDEEFEKNFSYEPKAHWAVFTPARALEPGRHYTLTFLRGLPAQSGPLGLEKPYKADFYTYPSLQVQGTLEQGCLPYTPGVRFSSPVRLGDLQAATTVSPQSARRELTGQEADMLGSEVVLPVSSPISARSKQFYQQRYGLPPAQALPGTAFFFTPLAFVKLSPRQPVTVTISKNLRDIYGNTLGKDYTFTVANNGYCPTVDFSGGFGVLESYLKPRLPIEVMNVASLPVQAARFNKENFIPFYTQNTRYCKLRALEHPTYDGNYPFAGQPDKSLKTFFDLSAFKPTAQDSIVFSQVKVERPGEEDGCWVSSTDNLTDVGVSLKTSPVSVLLWTTSLQTGRPLAGLAVELRDKTNRVLWQGTTDESGLARAPGWDELGGKTKSGWGQPELYAFISSPGGDAFLSTQLNEGFELWRFNVPYSYTQEQETFRTQLFTDRGVYRPGETVYVKGISRQLVQGRWKYPQGLGGTVSLLRADGEEVAKKKLPTTRTGAFDAAFEIPASAKTGMWELVFTPQAAGLKELPNQTMFVRVEAVKPADFEVTLQADKSAYTAGEEAAFHATARYQFGAPLSGAEARWSLKQETAWFEPPHFEQYTFVPYFLREEESKQDTKKVVDGSGTLDAKGAVSFKSPLPQARIPMEIFAQIGVQSPARQDLFARTSVLVHPADFYLGAKVLDENVQAGKPLRVHVVAVTPQGKPTSASVVANIRREQWYSVRKVGLNGRLEWVSEKQITDLPSQSLQVSGKGGELVFTPPQGGSYRVELVSEDGAGRPVRGGFEVYASGAEETYSRRADDDLLVLKQNKNVYKPGQKARITIESPYEQATALITVEREGILEAWVTSLKGANPVVEVPIKPEYLPNVYVGITLVRGRSAQRVNEQGVDLGKPQGKMGYVNLRVEPEERRIEVLLKTNAKHYRPGEEVTLELTTKAAGKRLPADVTVMVVDEGALALTKYETPDLFSYFYNSRPLSVFTADNRAYVIGQRNFGEKGENRGGGGAYDESARASFAQAKLGGVDLRSHFSFVPYFKASVWTDAKGRGEVKFKLPDNLTKFRIMALAAAEEEFGSAQTSVQVSKPLMITSNLPRFARQKDQFTCAAVVYNYEDKKGIFTVQATASGPVRLTGPAQQTVHVPLGFAQEVSWPCQALEVGTAQVDFTVRGKKSADGVRGQFPVETVEKEQTLALYASTSYQQEQLLEKPAPLQPQAQNRVEVSFASTALINLQGAAKYLLQYPYDCLEQQMSKILPVVNGIKLLDDFKLGRPDVLKKQAQAVLDRLAEYQAPNGGLGYWPGAGADPYVTAYALEVALLAKQAGYTVNPGVLQKAAAWLEEAFNKNQVRAYPYSSYETETARAYNVYVLALYGKPTAAAFNTLYARRTTLPPAAAAYLLKAAQVTKQSETVKQALAQRLLNQAQYTGESVYFTFSQPMPWLHMSDVQSTALALEALLVAQRPFADAFKAASWLVGQLNAQGHWNSTSGNAAALRALAAYYQKYEQEEPQFTASLQEGYNTLWNGSFQGRSAVKQTASFPFSQLYANGDSARLEVAKHGTGTLYYTVAQVYTPALYKTPVNAGFEISRQLSALDGSPVQEVQAGQRYVVTLTIRTAAARHFVAAEDFIPAGFELVNTSLATESQGMQELLSSKNEGAGTGFRYDEKYDGRIVAFAPYLPAGTHQYSYIVSARSRGAFAWPSAWVMQMYEPAVFGRNATSTLLIN